jgi:uncharacterized protein
MKLVFDTNILISATLWNGSVSQKLLFKLLRQQIPIYTSESILLEYENVLLRDFGYSKEEIHNIIKKILEFTILVSPKEHVKVVKDDPADDKIIDCALAAMADYIITYDKHLLKISTYKHIRIFRPEEFKEVK